MPAEQRRFVGGDELLGLLPIPARDREPAFGTASTAGQRDDGGFDVTAREDLLEVAGDGERALVEHDGGVGIGHGAKG